VRAQRGAAVVVDDLGEQKTKPRPGRRGELGQIDEQHGRALVVLGRAPVAQVLRRVPVEHEGPGHQPGQVVAVAPLEQVVPELGATHTWAVVQLRFNMSVPRARVPEKAPTLRERSER